jgi:multimeric flavodoxin WrbA
MSDVAAGAPAPRILAIAGSPRRHGNSDALLVACTEAAEASGARVDLLVASEGGIGACTGCNGCSVGGECVVRDRMQDVYPRIEAADAIVVATPVYFATVPSVLKALYDRCQPYWARRYVLHREAPVRRPGALLVVGGGGDPYGSSCAVTTTRSVFAVLGVDYLHELAIEADARGEALAQESALGRARGIGEALAREAARRSARS